MYPCFLSPAARAAIKHFKDATFGPGYEEQLAAEQAKEAAATLKRKAMTDAAIMKAATIIWHDLAKRNKVRIVKAASRHRSA